MNPGKIHLSNRGFGLKLTVKLRSIDPSFPCEAIKQIEQNFEQGTLAVKIWKIIDMEIKDSSGKFIMPDDPFSTEEQLAGCIASR